MHVISTTSGWPPAAAMAMLHHMHCVLGAILSVCKHSSSEDFAAVLNRKNEEEKMSVL